MAQAQAALLLTFHPGNLRNGLTQSNTAWLSKATQHAKTIRAHRSFSPRDMGVGGPSGSEKRRILARRIWWCCIVRDRMLSLGLHRELQIPESFPTLTLSDDFKYDVGHSPIHSVHSKRQMHEVFLAVSRLCVIVTDLLRSRNLDIEDEDEGIVLVKCRNQLETWFKATWQQFPDLTESREPQEQSFIIQRSFMYTYY